VGEEKTTFCYFDAKINIYIFNFNVQFVKPIV